MRVHMCLLVIAGAPGLRTVRHHDAGGFPSVIREVYRCVSSDKWSRLVAVIDAKFHESSIFHVKREKGRREKRETREFNLWRYKASAEVREYIVSRESII